MRVMRCALRNCVCRCAVFAFLNCLTAPARLSSVWDALTSLVTERGLTRVTLPLALDLVLPYTRPRAPLHDVVGLAAALLLSARDGGGARDAAARAISSGAPAPAQAAGAAGEPYARAIDRVAARHSADEMRSIAAIAAVNAIAGAPAAADHSYELTTGFTRTY
jgi:hypothetical protein